MGILAIIALPWLVLYNVKKSIRRKIKQGTFPGVYGDCTITLEPDGFRVVYRKGDALIKWNAVTTISESATETLFYFGEVEAMFVPSRAFASNIEREQFVETARRYRESAVGLVME